MFHCKRKISGIIYIIRILYKFWHKNIIIIFYAIRTSIFVLIVIHTVFRPLFSPAFFRTVLLYILLSYSRLFGQTSLSWLLYSQCFNHSSIQPSSGQFSYIFCYSDQHPDLGCYTHNVWVFIPFRLLQGSSLLYTLLIEPTWSSWLSYSQRFDCCTLQPSSGHFYYIFGNHTSMLNLVVILTEFLSLYHSAFFRGLSYHMFGYYNQHA